MNLNNRLRRSGAISARNILFSRDDKRNTNIHLDDITLASEQLQYREAANKMKNKDKPINSADVTTGDQLMLNKNPAKHHTRDTFEIVAETNPVRKEELIIRKVNNSLSTRKTRDKMYFVEKTKFLRYKRITNSQINWTTKVKLCPNLLILLDLKRPHEVMMIMMILMILRIPNSLVNAMKEFQMNWYCRMI